MSASIWNPGSLTQEATGNGTVTQMFILTSGQTLVSLTTYTYTPGASTIKVFLNGVLQVIGQDYIETSNSSITLINPATAGDTLECLGIVNLVNINTSSYDSAEVDIAVATTTDIGGVGSNIVRIVGSGTINSFGSNFKGPVFLRFTSAVTITNGAAMVCPAGVNLAVAAGYTCLATPKATSGVEDGWVISLLNAQTAFTSVGGDYTASIQSAINALLPYQELVIPYGTFNYTNLVFTGKTNFSLKILGQLVCIAAKPGGTGVDMRGSAAGQQTIKFDTCSHFNMYGSGNIQCGYREPLFFTSCTDFDVAVDCVGNGTNDNLSGLYIRYCQRFRFSSMVVDRVTLKNTNNITKVYTDHSNNVQIWDSSDFVFEGKFVSRNSGMNGIYVGSNCTDFVIADSICEYNAASGIQAAWSSFGAFPIRFSLSNNLVRYNQADGIYINNTSGSNIDIFATISGNIHLYNGWINCNPANLPGIDGSGIGTFMNVSRWTAAGNTAVECASYGVFVTNCNNWGIIGGAITKSNTGTVNSGVFISGGTSGEVYKLDVKVIPTLSALWMQSTNNVTLRGCSFDGQISLSNGSYPMCSMQDCRIIAYNQINTVFDFLHNDITVTNASQNGLFIASSYLTIDRNKIVATAQGITCSNLSYVLITNNYATSTGASEGVYVNNGVGCKLSGNYGTSVSASGVRLDGTSSNCEFSNNKGSSAGNSFRIESGCTGTNKWGNVIVAGSSSFLGTYGINF